MPQWKWHETPISPRGFRAAGVRSGIKSAGRDFIMIASEHALDSGAVFTQNCFCAAPVKISRAHAASGTLQAIVANSGCANACTGHVGQTNAQEMCELTASILNIPSNRILVASTGVIGQQLPMDLVRTAVPLAAAALSSDGFPAAAEGILTTDTHAKAASVVLSIDDKEIIITGMVKGSGMVSPHMATVFAFFATDACFETGTLQPVFARVMDQSINCVTVDGDTSTNDTACILSSGSAKNPAIRQESPECALFEQALEALAIYLARELARDGEGATRLITVHVSGAATKEDAERIASTIANSPLVKTAIFGNDPNWGRIAAAAGRSGVSFDSDSTKIRLNGRLLLDNGVPVAFDADSLSQSLKQGDVDLEFIMNEGAEQKTLWTCDFSYDYVRINADYHT